MTRWGTLPARKFRRALLAKGCDAFLVIARAAELALQVALEIELLVQARGPSLAHGHLDGGVSLCRSRGQARDELVGLARKLIVLDRAPDEAPALRFLRRQRFAGERKAERARLP